MKRLLKPPMTVTINITEVIEYVKNLFKKKENKKKK